MVAGKIAGLSKHNYVWQEMPFFILRGLGPGGARVGHSVCIVRQVLGSSHECFLFTPRKYYSVHIYIYIYMCFHLV